jgi:hypothetical protein
VIGSGPDRYPQRFLSFFFSHLPFVPPPRTRMSSPPFFPNDLDPGNSSDTLSGISHASAARTTEFFSLSDAGLSAQSGARGPNGYFPSLDNNHLYSQPVFPSSSVRIFICFWPAPYDLYSAKSLITLFNLLKQPPMTIQMVNRATHSASSSGCATNVIIGTLSTKN